MITLNGKPVEIGSFPDGTILMKPAFTEADYNCIEWRYENDRELVALIYLVNHIRRVCNNDAYISLLMPYVPNARMDRVKNDNDVFTLKYFADILNSLKFDLVIILDPHSDVSAALINNVRADTPEVYIERAVLKIQASNIYNSAYHPTDYTPLMFYPDSGAMKRYSGMIKLPYAYGLKKRDWETGKILGLDIVDNGNEIAGKDILIVDDICSRGGTFLHSAKKLKEHGANKIYLYISHCENTILEGELLTSGLIEKVFTTDSIFTKEHPLVEVLNEN